MVYVQCLEGMEFTGSASLELAGIFMCGVHYVQHVSNYR